MQACKKANCTSLFSHGIFFHFSLDHTGLPLSPPGDVGDCAVRRDALLSGDRPKPPSSAAAPPSPAAASASSPSPSPTPPLSSPCTSLPSPLSLSLATSRAQYSFLSSISTSEYDTHFFTPSENLSCVEVSDAPR